MDAARDGGVRGLSPLPFDHFFFCFLPPDAAGAWKGQYDSIEIDTINELAYHDI